MDTKFLGFILYPIYFLWNRWRLRTDALYSKSPHWRTTGQYSAHYQFLSKSEYLSFGNPEFRPSSLLENPMQKKLKWFIVLSEKDKIKWTELNNVSVIYNPLSSWLRQCVPKIRRHSRAGYKVSWLKDVSQSRRESS